MVRFVGIEEETGEVDMKILWYDEKKTKWKQTCF